MTQKLKFFIKDCLPPFLLRLYRKIKEPRYHGQLLLDQKMEKYLNYENGYFVELGANDGLRLSNTLYYEKYKNWSGILVECIYHKYLLCLKNRPKSKTFCNACVSFSYKEKFVEVAYSDLMTTPVNLETDVPDTFANSKIGKAFFLPDDDNINDYCFGAPAITLNQLLITAKAPNLIDFLSLDTEGSEIEVLKGIDHNKFRFKYICIECRDMKKMKIYMQSINYLLVEQLTVQDFLFSNNKK
jgi:hypothetical protein